MLKVKEIVKELKIFERNKVPLEIKVEELPEFYLNSIQSLKHQYRTG